MLALIDSSNERDQGHVVKPEHTSARFSLDPGEHMCRETCQVLTVAEDGSWASLGFGGLGFRVDSGVRV